MPAGINIFVVDSNNKAFNTEVVRWWYAGKRNKKIELKCLNQQCDKRLLKEKWIGPIVISADSSIVDAEDTSCWKLYHGEVLLDSSAEKVEIVMHYKSQVCK